MYVSKYDILKKNVNMFFKKNGGIIPLPSSSFKILKIKLKTTNKEY